MTTTTAIIRHTPQKLTMQMHEYKHEHEHEHEHKNNPHDTISRYDTISG